MGPTDKQMNKALMKEIKERQRKIKAQKEREEMIDSINDRV